MKIWQLGIAAALIGLASCTTVRHTADTAPVYSQVTSFTVADLDVSTQKVSKTVTKNAGFFKPVNVSELRRQAEALLCKENGCDIIVEPQFVVEKNFFGRHVLTVTGFPGKYTGFHNMTPVEKEIINGIISDENSEMEETPAINTDKQVKESKKEQKAQKKEKKSSKEKKQRKKKKGSGKSGKRAIISY